MYPAQRNQAQIKVAVISAHASAIEAQELQLNVAFALIGLSTLVAFWAA